MNDGHFWGGKSASLPVSIGSLFTKSAWKSVINQRIFIKKSVKKIANFIKKSAWKSVNSFVKPLDLCYNIIVWIE